MKWLPILVWIFFSCTNNAAEQAKNVSDPLGVPVGNGSGDYQRESIEVPHQEALIALLERFRPFQPKFVEIALDQGILGGKLFFWQFVKGDQPPEGTAYEACFKDESRQLEIRAVYRPLRENLDTNQDRGSIAFCRAYFKTAPFFVTDRDQNSQLATILHELTHYVYDVTKQETFAEEDEVEEMEGFFRQMIWAESDPAFASAAEKVGHLLGAFLPSLSFPEIAEVDKAVWQTDPQVEPLVSLLNSNEVYRTMYPGSFFFVNVKNFSGEQSKEFLEKANRKFSLSASGSDSVMAEVFNATTTDSTFGIYLIAVHISPDELAKMQPGHAYRIGVDNDTYEARWNIPQSVTITRALEN